MNNLLVLFGCFFAVFEFANGQLNQTCMHTKLVTPRHFFETDKVLGKWYAVEMYSGLTIDAKPFQIKCLETEIYRNSTTNSKILGAKETFYNFQSGLTESVQEDIVIDDAMELEAIWRISTGSGGEIETADAVWLQTDFENWAIQYGCQINDNYRYEMLAIMSRERTIDPKTLEIMRVLASGYGFPPQNIRPMNQVGC